MKHARQLSEGPPPPQESAHNERRARLLQKSAGHKRRCTRTVLCGSFFTHARQEAYNDSLEASGGRVTLRTARDPMAFSYAIQYTRRNTRHAFGL